MPWLLTFPIPSWAAEDCAPGSYVLSGPTLAAGLALAALALVVSFALGRSTSRRHLLGTALGAGLAAVAAIGVLSQLQPCPEPAPTPPAAMTSP